MVRTNGNLKPFLMEALENNFFPNLNWENDTVFNLILPRYNDRRRQEFTNYEYILKKWYSVNENLGKYRGYSRAKGVFQAGLKKSPYLVKLDSIGNMLRFRFANHEEEKEKRRLQKEKANAVSEQSLEYLDTASESEAADVDMLPELGTSLLSPTPSESSSGYHSDSENSEDCIQIIFNDLMKVTTPDQLDNFVNDCLISMEKGNIGDISLLKDFDLSDPPNQTDGMNTINTSQPMLEMSATPIDTSIFIEKTFWLCSKKLDLETLLLLICDKQPIDDRHQGVLEGQIVIPNTAWKPGVSYQMIQSCEGGGKLVCFCVPNRSV